MSEKKQEPHPLHDAEKSWPQVHKQIRLAQVKSKNIQRNLVSAIRECDELINLYREIFTHIPQTDGTIFGLSPMSPANVIEALMDQIFKSEGPNRYFARRIKSRSTEPFKALDFSDAQDRALGWAVKMEKKTKAEIENLV